MWAAVTIVRIRAWSRATVGKTTGWAKIPSSKRRWLKRPAVSGSPIITGVIGVSERAGVEPEPGQLGLEPARARPESLDQPGSSCITRIASRHAAATAGGWDVEKRNGRARWTRMSRRSCEPAT